MAGPEFYNFTNQGTNALAIQLEEDLVSYAHSWPWEYILVLHFNCRSRNGTVVDLIPQHITVLVSGDKLAGGSQHYVMDFQFARKRLTIAKADYSWITTANR